MPAPTLPISDLINVQVSLTPTAAQSQSTSNLLLLGNSSVIDPVTRKRDYTTIAQVATDFGTSAPEYLAALLWFEQSPQPNQLSIGRWVQTASAGQLFGSPLTPTNTLIATWQAIVSGGFSITIDALAIQHLSGLNFGAVTNLNGVATVINAVLVGAVVTYDAVNNRFIITSNTTGAASNVTFATAPSSGADISVIAGLRSTNSGSYVSPGLVPESAVSAVTFFDTTFGQQWFGLIITGAVDADVLAVAPYIEAANTYHYFGFTVQVAGSLVSSSTTDLGFVIKALGYKRTCGQYSSINPYAVVSYLARLLTVDYTGNNTVITLMYKQEPGIQAETLNETQMAQLLARNLNVFVAFNNNTAIIRPGVSVSGDFTDSVVGAAAFAIAIQTNVYNGLFTSLTKIPQTDAGVHQIVTIIEETCSQFVVNGLLAPGTWNSAGVGTIKTGDNLPKGYFTFVQPIALQNQSDRAARKSPLIQVLAKLGGAIHTVNVSVSVNP